MMMQISWEIPLSLIEDRFRGDFMLEDEVRVVDCTFDEMADAVIFRFEVDEDDYGKIPVSGPDGRLLDANL
jgi:hypothetical protein